MTNEVSYYKFKELVLLDTEPDQVFVILRSKFYTNLNGASGWSFMLQAENEKVYNEGTEMWFDSTRLKKLHVPSDYSFEGLMVVLKGIVERRDFE